MKKQIPIVIIALLIVCPSATTYGQGLTDQGLVVKAELQTLLDEVTPRAGTALEDDQEFYPFGAVLHRDGSVRWVDVPMGNEDPSVQEVADVLLIEIRNKAKEDHIKAMAIVAMVSINMNDSGMTSDAIGVSLEHENSVAFNFVIPYQILDDGTIRTGQPFESKRHPQVFSWE